MFGLRLADVIEVMRRLPVSPMPGMPPFVEGVSVIRGAPVPVVDMRALLGEGQGGDPSARFVTVRVDGRRVALAVTWVIGVGTVDGDARGRIAPLLRDARPDLVAALDVLDGQLLTVLEAGGLVPDDAWDVLEHPGEHPGTAP